MLPPALGGALVGVLRAGTHFDERLAADAGKAPQQAAAQGMAGARALAAPVLRALAAAVSLGTGASLGPEGPSVDIGRAAARGLAGVLRSRRRRLLPLVAAGSGAGALAQRVPTGLCQWAAGQAVLVKVHVRAGDLRWVQLLT